MELEEEDADEISFSLIFSGEPCTACGTPGEPGRCGHCGGEVPASAETGEAAAARRSALGPFKREIADLTTRFAVLAGSVPTIPVSLGQFTASVTDARLYDLVLEVMDTGLVDDIDLNDRHVIGTRLRSAFRNRIALCSELCEVCEELAQLSVEAPADEARELAIAAGQRGVDILEAYLIILTAPDSVSARVGEARMNELFSEFGPATRMSELLSSFESVRIDDIDARASRILGRDGVYTDEFGMLAPALVFSAFAGQEQPFLSLAAAGRQYFSHLLPADLPSPELGVVLALSAVTVGVLDRPFVAHRCARLSQDLMNRAFATDRGAAMRVAEQVGEQSKLIFAAGARIARGVRLLALGEKAGALDEETVLDSVLKTYLEIAESALRTYGWFALQLTAINDGTTPEPAHSPPSLGELTQRLACSSEPLCQELAKASDSALRNAVAHAQYVWSGEDEEVVDLRTEDRWSVEDLEHAVHSLVGAVAGTDAGYACVVVGEALDIAPPAWATSGGHAVSEMFVAASFSAYGARVESISAGQIRLEAGSSVDALTLLPVLSGVTSLLPHVEVFEVYVSTANEPTLSVSAEALNQVRDAPENFKDLAIFDAMLDVVSRRMPAAVIEIERIAATLVKVVAVTSLQEFVESPTPTGTLSRAIARLERARTMIRSEPVSSPFSDAADRRLKRVIAAAFAARRGGPIEIKRFAGAVTGLFSWAEERGAAWPPL